MLNRMETINAKIKAANDKIHMGENDKKKNGDMANNII